MDMVYFSNLDQEPIRIQLRFDSINPNVNGGFMYTPPFLSTDDVSENSEDDAMAANKSCPVVLSFVFNEQPFEPESGRTSPVREATPVPKKRHVTLVDEALSPIEELVKKWEPAPIIADKIIEDENQEIRPLVHFDTPALHTFRFPTLKQPISRHERARLASAGFQPTIDLEGHVVNSIGSTSFDKDRMLIDPELEFKDKLSLNNITIMFMGATFKPMAHKGMSS